MKIAKIRNWKFLQQPFIKKPLLAIYDGLWDAIAHLLSDKAYVKLVYKLRMNKELNLAHPQSFNEKLNWLKLYDRYPLYSLLADKYEVKEYVAQKIGKEYVVPNYGVWEKFEDIDFDTLPNQFVLKTTGDSSGVIICRDKSNFDKEQAAKKIAISLKTNYYYRTREWPYKDIHPRIIADMLLDEHTGKELQDYKFWCFNGEPKVMYITNKGKSIYENFYDMDFKPLDINHGFPRTIPEYKKPVGFDKMKQLAATLSHGIPFVRVDFFFVDNKIYFGEFTFYDWAGLKPFTDDKIDLKLGDLLQLPNIKIS